MATREQMLTALQSLMRGSGRELDEEQEKTFLQDPLEIPSPAEQVSPPPEQVVAPEEPVVAERAVPRSAETLNPDRINELVAQSRTQRGYDTSRGAIGDAATHAVDEEFDAKARGYDTQAGIHGRALEQKRADNTYAREQIEHAREGMRSADADFDRDYEAYRQKLDEKPSGMGFLKALSMIAMIGSMGTGKLSEGGKGAALGSMVNGMMQSKVDELTADQNALEKKLRAAGYKYDHKADAVENELRAAAGLNALVDSEVKSEIEQAMAASKSEEARAAGRQALAELGVKRAQAERQIAVKREQHVLAQRRRQQDDILWRIPIDQLTQLNAEGKLGKDGQKVLAERMKEDQRTREQEADITKKSGESEKEIIPGYTQTLPLEPAIRADVQRNTAMMAQVNEILAASQEIAKRNKNGIIVGNDAVLLSNYHNRINGMISQASGMGAPSEGERKSIMEGLPKPGLNGEFRLQNPEQLYGNLIEQNKREQSTRLRSIGVVPKEGSQSGGTPQPKPPTSFGRR